MIYKHRFYYLNMKIIPKIPNCIMNISKLPLRLTKLTTKYILNDHIYHYVILNQIQKC